MVRTQHDIDDLPPLEKIKHLQAEQKRRQEELEQLEKEKKEALEKTRERIKNSILEQQEEEEEQLEEEERRAKEELEEIVEEATPEKAPPPPVQYGDALQVIRQGTPGNVYTMTNYNVVNEVDRLREKAAQGQILSQAETQFIQNAQYNMERIQRNDMYVSQQQQTYISRVEDTLKDLNKQLHLR